jgi:mannitol-1-phosphate 5-dehydrogenase
MTQSRTPRAVVFGAGKMGCGLIGHVLTRSGFSVTFVARRADVVNAINRHHGYRLIVAGRSEPEVIRGCSALRLQDADQVTLAVATADAVFTAVGIDNLASITPAISAGLFLRTQLRGDVPLNVIACENLPGTGAYLGHQILCAGSPGTRLCVERVGGFSAATTRRVMTGGVPCSGELCFSVDSDHPLVIDAAGLRGALPPLQGAFITEQFAAELMRKFFTVNCTQAVAAYLGYRHGCKYIHEAVTHPEVAPIVSAALAEATAALEAEFPNQAAAIAAEAAEVLDRLASGEPADPIYRVGREPRRKLSPRERLVGPARLAQRHGLPTEALAQAIAAALAYDAPTDAQAVGLQQTIAQESLETVLTEDCGLLPHEPLARRVKHHWQRLVLAEPLSHAPVLPAARTRSVVPERLQAVVFDLARQYDPKLVLQAVARVSAA